MSGVWRQDAVVLGKGADTTLARKAPRDLLRHMFVMSTATVMVPDVSTDAASNDVVMLFETCERCS